MNRIKILIVLCLNCYYLQAQQIESGVVQYVNITYVYNEKGVSFEFFLVDTTVYYTDIIQSNNYMRCMPKTGEFKKNNRERRVT